MIRKSLRDGVLPKSEQRSAVRAVLARAPMSMSQVNKLFFYDEDEPFVTAALLEFQKTALKGVSRDIQTKLIEIVASKVKDRGPGGGRALLQFTSWLFLVGERHWKLKAKQALQLSAVSSMVSWDGAALLKGHDMVANPEDIRLAQDILKELANYVSGPYAVGLLRKYKAAQKKQLPGFIAMLKETAPGERSDPKSAGILFNKLMLARLYQGNIIGLQYGAAAIGMIGKVMFKL